MDGFFEIYFSDLNENAQKQLMEAVGITDPAEMNWDIDMVPIGMYPLPIEETEYILTHNGVWYRDIFDKYADQIRKAKDRIILSNLERHGFLKDYAEEHPEEFRVKYFPYPDGDALEIFHFDERLFTIRTSWIFDHERDPSKYIINVYCLEG